MTSTVADEEPPSGFRAQREGRSLLWVRGDQAAGLARAGFTPAGTATFQESDLAGRRPLFELSVGDERLLVRRFSHGGLLRWLTGARFRDPRRPFRELALSEALRARGIRTPEVVAARARPAPLFGWHLELVSRRMDDVVDLAQVLVELQAGRLARRAVARLLRELGSFLRRMHDAGLCHADLQPANLIVNRSALQGAEVELGALDLDRSELARELGEARRGRNLARLLRHVRRRQAQGRRALTRTDFMRVLRGYEGEREARHRAARAMHELSREAHAAHRLGWWLEALVRREA
jgi:tRNA A-37 threonylcarbamoyl transferase component Bud32